VRASPSCAPAAAGSSRESFAWRREERRGGRGSNLPERRRGSQAPGGMDAFGASPAPMGPSDARARSIPCACSVGTARNPRIQGALGARRRGCKKWMQEETSFCESLPLPLSLSPPVGPSGHLPPLPAPAHPTLHAHAPAPATRCVRIGFGATSSRLFAVGRRRASSSSRPPGVWVFFASRAAAAYGGSPPPPARNRNNK